MATGMRQYGFGAKLARYADDGKYFSVTNPTPGTGIITGVVTSLADTTPYIVFKNNNTVGSGISCYLDKLILDVTVVGTTFSGSRKWASKIDTSQSVTRYTSGGTTFGSGNTIPCNNTNADKTTASAATGAIGAITAAAAGSARLIESGTLCSAIEVVFSTFVFDFGSSIAQPVTGLVDNSTTPMHKYFPCMPTVLGPQETWTFHIWGATLAAGITFGVNLGWWEV